MFSRSTIVTNETSFLNIPTLSLSLNARNLLSALEFVLALVKGTSPVMDVVLVCFQSLAFLHEINFVIYYSGKVIRKTI